MKIVYVDGFRVRNVFGDMNFNLLGRNPDWDYHWYIPPHEIWIDGRARKETASLVANDNRERKIKAYGKNYWRVRKKFCKPDAVSLDELTIKKQYAPGFLIRRVSGNLVRSFLDYSFVVGGHHKIYPWYIPKNEVWIDNTVRPAEEKYILTHEITEFKLMKRGTDYYNAHYNHACMAEKKARARDGIAYYPQKNLIEPLPYIRFGEGKKKILIVSGIHGDEPSGPYAIAKFLIKAKKTPGKRLDFMPVINPGGFEKGTRQNEEKKDINRWFFDKPKSGEPGETKILRSYFAQPKKTYDLLISLHEDYERKEFYLYDIGYGRNSKIIRNILASVIKSKIPLFSGIDDIKLKNFAINGYIPVERKSSFPSFEEYLSRNDKTKRGIIIEIPGKLELNIKMNLAKKILEAALKAA